MLRHRLAALFEPRSLLVLSYRPLPVVLEPPTALERSSTFVHIDEEGPVQVPDTLNGVSPGARLDLALLCVDSPRLPQALDALRQHRPRALILLSTDKAPENALEDMVYCRSWALLNGCCLLGPRSFGTQRPGRQLNFSHMPHIARTGRVALVAQSRSLVAAVLDWAVDVKLGFSAVISLGDEAGVSVAEVLDYLATDAATDSIALYLEDTASSRELTSALRSAAGVKPVVVLKAGHASSDREASNAVFDAMLRRAGAVRVPYFLQLFSAIKVLRYRHRPQGRRIALFSNGAGAAQLALDIMGPSAAVEAAQLSSGCTEQLASILEPGAQVSNPVVTTVPLTPAMVRKVVETLVADPGVDGVLVLVAPDPLAEMPAVARQLAVLAPDAKKPVINCFMGESNMRALRQYLDEVGTPAFRTPESAAAALGVLASYHYNQALALQTLPPEPLARPPRTDAARDLVNKIRSERRSELDPGECRQLLDYFYVPILGPMPVAGTSGTAPGEEPLMAVRVDRDPRFGPYIHFGAGGMVAESVRGRAVELPPLNAYLARQLVERSAIWKRVLSREMSPAAFDCLLESLERISDLVSELPEIESLVIDPLMADSSNLTAYSIRVQLSRNPILTLPETSGYRHMAIHPYPRQLVRSKTFSNGDPWVLRPIRPEDAQLLQEFIRGLSQESRYMRFVSMLRELTPRMLARYTRIDYDRELALIATVQVPQPEHRGHLREQIIGFAHYLRNPDGRGAEYALVVGDDWQRLGLGTQLMGGLIEAAQMQGLTYIDGYVLTTNRAMLRLMESLGFADDAVEDDPTTRRVWLDLGETRAMH